MFKFLTGVPETDLTGWAKFQEWMNTNLAWVMLVALGIGLIALYLGFKKTSGRRRY